MAVTTETAAAIAARPLPAHRSRRVELALQHQRSLLRELASAFGGPYHVLFGEQFDHNLERFRAVAAEQEVPLGVYFAKKSNKAAEWVRRCADLGCGVDVASIGELRDALAHGVRGADLVVTGPAKPAELLRLAIRHGATIALDALDELARLTGPEMLGGPSAGPARVLLRARPRQEPDSRFGLSDAELDLAIDACARAVDRVEVSGFSVHLSGYEPGPRAAEAVRLARLCSAVRDRGLTPTVVSIGGGFPVDYVDAGSWAAFTDDPRLFHAGRRFGGFYPYHCPRPGPDMLRSVLLSTPDGDGRTVASVLRDHGVRLLVEPGRALLDQAGFTVFTVLGVKDRDGYLIVTVDGTSLSLSEQWFDSEFLPDPVLLPAAGDGAPEPAEICVGGASCLESDMLTWRRVPLPRRPEIGDLLVYLNTAGYQMDSNESPFHELPLPPKVVFGPPRGEPRWRLDRPGDLGGWAR